MTKGDFLKNLEKLSSIKKPVFNYFISLQDVEWGHKLQQPGWFWFQRSVHKPEYRHLVRASRCPPIWWERIHFFVSVDLHFVFQYFVVFVVFFSPSSLLFHLQYLSCLPSLSWLVEVALVHSLATAGSKFFWQDMIRWWNLYDVKWHSGDILKPPLSDLFSTVWHKGLATSRGVLTTGEINFNCCPAILEFGLFFWNMSNISW